MAAHDSTPTPKRSTPLLGEWANGPPIGADPESCGRRKAPNGYPATRVSGGRILSRGGVRPHWGEWPENG